ncbi:hypothetical protein MCOR25_010056, partial [Pyricularia grisea]
KPNHIQPSWSSSPRTSSPSTARQSRGPARAPRAKPCTASSAVSAARPSPTTRTLRPRSLPSRAALWIPKSRRLSSLTPRSGLLASYLSARSISPSLLLTCLSKMM